VKQVHGARGAAASAALLLALAAVPLTGRGRFLYDLYFSLFECARSFSTLHSVISSIEAVLLADVM
jgi:hypothetical protein